ncbi:hypothetical protein DESPIG_00241 [Desulfovibrio piger ATCC 29098]|uniref:Uncharacterized protein n=1 Tax=Desulfovibrio piger ATCC 29098 TaxID=411464 RepID=B6WQB7_9BACT|nr:hypothetical protein DESPIG_00241 [Desulfovibrio piger ATCC 29098]
MFAAAVPSFRASAGMCATGQPGPAFPVCRRDAPAAGHSRRHGMVPCPRPGRGVFPGLSLRLPVRGARPGILFLFPAWAQAACRSRTGRHY